ncbi:DUF4145 domain-containing protein [Leucobacter sp. HNU]|uniref:DUF4145 domain-containing protein n=1 Tax=Leucobacter sp. HNU TaxID=3236805 RepID=UPI003A811A5D
MLAHRCAFCGNQTHFTARHGRYGEVVGTDAKGYKTYNAEVASTCDACQRFNIAKGVVAPESSTSLIAGSEISVGLTKVAEHMTDITWSPPSMVAADIEYIPEEIAGFYQEAHDAFSIGAYRAVLLLSRSVIEATAKMKDVGGSNLVKKIDNLHEEGHIRRGVKQVAHAIRHLGNDIAHGDLTDPRPQKMRLMS